MMKLTDHFSLEEMTKSQTAERLGLDNTPSAAAVRALRDLCEHVLEPIRSVYGPFTPSSGYRSPELNRAIGGARKSSHMDGCAADIEVPGTSNLELATWIRDNLEFDQLILEYYVRGKPSSGWVHVSWKDGGQNRNEVLTAVKGEGYVTGLVT